jgi:chromosome segregation ATPase
LSSTNLQQSIEERELDLALREAELNRRESALRRAEVARANVEEGPGARASSVNEDELVERLAALERRERELEQTVAAVESQRLRLEEVRAEYESRRDGLTARARELEAERNRLRDEQARLLAESLALEERERGLPVIGAEAPAEPEAEAPVTQAATKVAADAFKDPEPAPPRSRIDEWWAKQLGSPLEAA